MSVEKRLCLSTHLLVVPTGPLDGPPGEGSDPLLGRDAVSVVLFPFSTEGSLETTAFVG